MIYTPERSSERDSFPWNINTTEAYALATLSTAFFFKITKQITNLTMYFSTIVTMRITD
jgi:hypothetical protein